WSRLRSNELCDVLWLARPTATRASDMTIMEERIATTMATPRSSRDQRISVRLITLSPSSVRRDGAADVVGVAVFGVPAGDRVRDHDVPPGSRVGVRHDG